MACGEITLGSAADCDNLPAGGTRAKAIVFNYDDIVSYSEDPEVGGVITDITLKPGKYGYEFTGLGNSFKKAENFNRSASTGLGTFKHSLSIIIYERTQEQKDNINDLKNGRFVVVMFNRGDDADSIELYGKQVGVELQPGTVRDAYANDGLFVLSFATPEGDFENEKELPQSVWITDYSTTEAMLDALLPTS